MALTWRDTAAPNFNTSVDATRLAGQSLNNAFSGASDALGKFHEWQQAQAGNALANNEIQYPDAASQAAAVANGSMFNGVDRSNLTPDALKGITNRSTTLLDQATTQQNLNQNNSMNPLKVQQLSLANQGQGITNTTEAGKSPYLIQGAQLTNGQTQAQTRSINATAGGQEQTNKLGGDAAADISLGNGVAADLKGAYGTYEQAAGALADMRSLSPNARTHAAAMLLQYYPEAAATGKTPNPAAAISAATGGPAPLPVGSNLSQGQGFLASLPNGTEGVKDYASSILGKTGDLSNQTIDQKVAALMPQVFERGSNGQQYAQDGSTLLSIDPKTGKPSIDPDAARGIGQIKPSIFDSMVQANPSIKGTINDKDANAQAAAAYMKSLLIKYNGNPEMALAAYNASPAQVDRWSMNAPDQLEQGFKEHQISGSVAQRDAAALVGKVQAPGIAAQYTDLQKRSDIPNDQVISSIKSNKDGAFATVDPDLIQGQLDFIKTAAKNAGVPMNNVTAGAMLNQYGSFHKAGWFTPNTNGYAGGRDSIFLNTDGMQQDIARMKDPAGLAASSGAANTVSALSNAVQQAQENERSAHDALLGGLQKKTEQPTFVGVPKLQSEYGRAGQKLQKALDDLKGYQSQIPDSIKNPPTPPPVSLTPNPGSAAVSPIAGARIKLPNRVMP